MLIHNRYNIPDFFFLLVRSSLRPILSPRSSARLEFHVVATPTLAQGLDGMVVHRLYGLSGSHISQSSDRMSDMRPDSLGSCGEIDSVSCDAILAESVLRSTAAAVWLSSS